jgi:hypothetical protein
MSNQINTVLEYFSGFYTKNIDKVSENLAEDVILYDWNVKAIGKENVSDAIKDIFFSVESIMITPINLHIDDNTVVARIEIQVDGEEILRVVDVIDLRNKNGKWEIIKIDAYKQ